MNKQEIEELFYIKKDYSKIKEILNNPSDAWSFNLLAKICIQEKEITKAQEYFNKTNNITGCAYCEFIQGRVKEAKAFLLVEKEPTSVSKWLFYLCSILQNDFSFVPTYFQIRNFYEQDLEILFEYGQKDIINKILHLSSVFEKYNGEIHKFNGRVLKNNGYYDFAEECLLKSIDICYKDPETHYLLGELYEIRGNFQRAKEEYQKAVDVNNGYYPAYKKLTLV